MQAVEATIARVVGRHFLTDDAGHCACGRWFEFEEDYAEHAAAEVMAALRDEHGLREHDGFGVDFGRIERVAHHHDGRPMSRVTHQHLTTDWTPTEETR